MTSNLRLIRTVGQMSLGGSQGVDQQFRLWRRCLESLRDKCDELYLRFDKRTGDAEVLGQLDQVCGSKLQDVLISATKWNRWNWREEMLRMLDSVEPDIVLAPDQDEEFEDGLLDELKLFIASPKQCMMFSYVAPMPTDDGVAVNGGPHYPRKPHMKVYKWRPNLSYRPYQGFAKIRQYASSRHHWKARTRIRHYCYYTRELRKMRGLAE